MTTSELASPPVRMPLRSRGEVVRVCGDQSATIFKAYASTSGSTRNEVTTSAAGEFVQPHVPTCIGWVEVERYRCCASIRVLLSAHTTPRPRGAHCGL